MLNDAIQILLTVSGGESTGSPTPRKNYQMALVLYEALDRVRVSHTQNQACSLAYIKQRISSRSSPKGAGFSKCMHTHSGPWAIIHNTVAR